MAVAWSLAVNMNEECHLWVVRNVADVWKNMLQRNARRWWFTASVGRKVGAHQMLLVPPVSVVIDGRIEKRKKKKKKHRKIIMT